MATVTSTILTGVLNFLHITYTLDSYTEDRIKNEISEGIEFIHRYCDPEADCAPGSTLGSLLCEYVLRAESGAVESFKADFLAEINSERMTTDVAAYAAAMGYTDDDDD